ncbi:MAG: aldo/keto reductase, partial [Chloroflexota bacterium]
AAERGVGVIGMKSLAAGTLVSETPIDPKEAIRYALSQDISSLCVGVDSRAILDQDLAIAENFKPMTQQEQSRLRHLAFEHAWDGRHERFKVSHEFEGPEGRIVHGMPLATP